MRLFTTADVFAVARVIRASGIREELRAIISKSVESDAPTQEIGIDGMLTVLEVFAEKKAEAAIYEVLAGPMEMTAKKVADMPLADLFDALKKMAEMNDFKRFFGYVSGVVGKN